MSEIKARPAPFMVTDSAARRIAGLIAEEGRPGLKLRVSVSGGGCSGFQYGFALDDKDEEGDVVIARDALRVHPYSVQTWDAQSSGTVIKPMVEGPLEKRWAELTGKRKPPPLPDR